VVLFNKKTILLLEPSFRHIGLFAGGITPQISTTILSTIYLDSQYILAVDYFFFFFPLQAIRV